MFYSFGCDGASIRRALRSDAAARGDELIINRPHALISVEGFVAPPDLNRRRRELERTLTREGWSGPRRHDA